MPYYHDLITQKSWQLLQSLGKKFDFVLIGGWAVFLYTGALKSKDIDLILDYPQLEQMKNEFSIIKNERLKKYEAKTEEIDIDIYLPFYSDLGVPVEEVVKLTMRLEGFKVPKIELLALLKAKALTERKNSTKGRKDLIDLVSLFALESFSFGEFRELAEKYRLNELVELVGSEIKIISQIEELGLNVHRMAVFKRKILPQLLTQ
ncbi:hypothetical protein COT03_02105 [Candidatus Shapirobacteria bacterium CG07_land_8_20_14_0_80_39_18]|uniref:Nucleotidyl transferase AbiEii/AbiGii toxin family protein n=1 Tax=Candidatus Shapirobacteria bacterium CG07_land_8_20_14_0_80_39_18 TaxID=1974882 RepID=A0A2M6YR59_9BACT|nr:MAG: hypothetical protein COT03_02105 [Candidatus Shapirobacteria bacterium CG07_land_8_20_14_0_80_39_18]